MPRADLRWLRGSQAFWESQERSLGSVTHGGRTGEAGSRGRRSAEQPGPPCRSKRVPTALQPRRSPSPAATPHSLFSLPLACIATADAHPTDDFDGD